MYQVIETSSYPQHLGRRSRIVARCKTLLRAIRCAARLAPLNDDSTFRVVGHGYRLELSEGAHYISRAGARYAIGTRGHPSFCTDESGYLPSVRQCPAS